jgi:hypothetical protein
MPKRFKQAGFQSSPLPKIGTREDEKKQLAVFKVDSHQPRIPWESRPTRAIDARHICNIPAAGFQSLENGPR